MWQLRMTNAAGAWFEVDEFESAVAAARRIREIEGYDMAEVVFRVRVDTEHDADADAFAKLEHLGLYAAYALTRQPVGPL